MLFLQSALAQFQLGLGPEGLLRFPVMRQLMHMTSKATDPALGPLPFLFAGNCDTPEAEAAVSISATRVSKFRL